MEVNLNVFIAILKNSVQDKKKYGLLFFVLFCAAPSFLFAQKKFLLEIKKLPSDVAFISKEIDLPSQFLDSLSVLSALQNWQKNQIEQGFLESNVDGISVKDSVFSVQLHVGNRYEWITLKKGNIPNFDLEKIGFREKNFYRKVFNYKELSNWFKRILTFEENNGYPFASVCLDSVIIQKNGKISADLKLKKGKKIIFDKIILEDDSTKMSVSYLARFLDISPKMLFNKSKVSAIKNRIRELPFLSLEGEPFLTFEDNKASVHLTLKRKPASRFDALLGILPENSITPTDTRRFALTGTLNLDLWNSLNKGERFQVDFQRFKAKQQQLKVQVNLPYLANLPLGADANLDIYRRESFTVVQYAFGTRYMIAGNDYVKIYWHGAQNTAILSKEDSNQIILNKKLPQNLDIDVSSYGIEWQKQHLDYRFNPRKGWSFFLKTDVGTRKIIKSSKILDLKSKTEPDFDYGTLYDTLQLRSLRWQGSFLSEFYIPIFQRSTIKIALRCDGIFPQTPIFQNEQYRLGGNRLQRGFDEDAIFATRFAYTNIEYRFLIGQNSFFSLFSDVSYIENITKTVKIYDNYLGFGAGLNFETRAGIFAFNYALGKKNKNPIDLRAGKIHFGYISIF